MNIPAIVLAGGFGTRLQKVVKDVPKPMADINGKPFLHYVFLYLKQQGIHQVVLSIGYKADIIKDYFKTKYEGIDIRYSEEVDPLGTGGGIRQALDTISGPAFILNGDTFFDVDLHALYKFYSEHHADIAISLKKLEKFDRYGTVMMKDDHRITQFIEKQYLDSGLINGGVYITDKLLFMKAEDLGGIPLPARFSFEKEIFEKHVTDIKITGKVFNGYFIDIGIPEDYQKAAHDFKVLF